MQTTSPRDPTRRFSDRAEYYLRARPHYPQALLHFCRSDLELRPGDAIADVGSGTGLLSELFLPNGNPVFAIEPNPEMRQAAERLLSRFPNFHSRSASAESTGLPDESIQFVVAGTAFHWFDRNGAKLEFSRILTPGGYVLLVWNKRRREDDLNREYERIVRKYEIDPNHAARGLLSTEDPAELREFFAPQTFQTRQFDNSQSLDLETLLARALSSSNLPLPGQPRCQEMLDELREVFARHARDGRVIQQYDTRLFFGRLK